MRETQDTTQRISDIDPNRGVPYRLLRRDLEEASIVAMTERAQERLLSLRGSAVMAALNSSAWGDEYPSLRTFPFRAQWRAHSKGRIAERVDPFEPTTGAVNVLSNMLSISELGRFFTPLRIKPGEVTQLRGLSYYTALDFSKNTPDKKLKVITKDIKDGLEVISSVDRRSLGSVDYMVYLGVLDHLKSHALTTFHALTFHERTGMMPENADYLSLRHEAERVMSTFTRAFYQACLGRPFDTLLRQSDLVSSLDRVADYIATSGHSAEHFTFPEVVNPIIIMLGAHEAARRKPYPDTIIGIPSGGSEVAVVTSLMYEILNPQLGVPDTLFIPLSFHFQTQRGISADSLAEIIAKAGNVSGKHVLMVDDNSNTGSTIQRMIEALARAGTEHMSVHLAEIDPMRVIINSKKENIAEFGEAYVVNMDHPDFETAMGISGASTQDGSDLRRKKIRRFVEKRHKQLEKNSN